MADDHRLDGWKAIGNFLGRDRTTAIRWARERGLPVHRVPGGRTGTVYALARELSDWMANGVDAVRPAAVEPADFIRQGAIPTADTSVETRPPERQLAYPRAAIVAVVLCAVAIIAFLSWRATSTAEAPVGIASTILKSDDAATRAFGRDLTADLARFANASHGLAVYDPDGVSNPRTDYSVRTAIDGAVPHLNVRVWLTSTNDGAVLWSRRIEQSTPEIAALRERVAANVVGIVRCSIAVLSDERSRIAASELTLLLSACEALLDLDPALASARARELTVRRPDIAAGWATLAIAQAQLAGNGGDRGLSEQARRNAARANELAPGSLAAHFAILAASGISSPFSLPVVNQALLSYPDEPDLLRSLSIMLFNAGYVRDSVAPVLGATRGDPTSMGSRDMLARRLAAAGRIDEANRVQEENERLWPGHPHIMEQRSRMVAEAGGQMPGNKAELAALIQAERTGPHTAYMIARWHERAGNRRSALAWLARAPVDDTAYQQWSALFWPQLAGLRTEPAFFDKMAQIGLVRIWLARKRWPDFCSEPGLKYDCAKRAAALGLMARS